MSGPVIASRRAVLGMTAGLLGASAVGASPSAAEPVSKDVEVALFRDATEVLFAIADQRHAADPSAPPAPRRHFVKDADEAHRLALDGPNPIVGMSLDDLLECATGAHAAAGDLVAIAGVHRGFLWLMAAPGVNGIKGLKGRRVAVDTDTGYASALYEILARDGVDRRRDVEVVYAGATNLRYEKLMRGEFDATLLGAPYTRMAARAGFQPLNSVIGALGGYQAVALVARRSWLAGNAAQARAVTGCLRATLAWAGRPENRTALEAMVRVALPTLDASAVGEVSEDLFGSTSEFLADGRMRAADTRVVLDLFNASRGKSLSPDILARLTDSEFLAAP